MGTLLGEPKGPPVVKSICKMIESFNGMELSSSSDEMKDLAALCSEFQLEVQKEAADIDIPKLIGNGKKAVGILLSNQSFNIPCFGEHVDDDDAGNPNRSLSSSLFVASLLNVMGMACSKLKSYDQSLIFLKWAEKNLPNLESGFASCCVDCCLVIWHVNQFRLYKAKRELYNVKFDVKLIDECPDHMIKILEIKKKKTKGEICLELGDANRDVSFAYHLCGKVKEAVPYLARALEIYETDYDYDYGSPEILEFRRFLSFMYAEAEDYVKALEQIQLCQTVYKIMEDNLGVLYTMVDRGSYLVMAKMYDDAIDVIGKVVTHTDAEKMLLAKAFQFLALACFHSGKFDDAIKHLESSSEILDKLEINPQDQLQRRLFEEQYDRLIVFIGKVCEAEQAISLLEDVLGKLKEKFGEKCLEVGYCSHVLGFNYFKSDNFEVAAQNFAYAKRVLGDHLGPSDVRTLTSHFSLAVTYAKMRSFDLAIEYQEEVIEHLKGLGGSQQYFLDAAILDLKQMKEDKSSEEPSCSSRVPTDVSSLLTEIMEQAAKSKRRGRRSY